MSTTIQKFGWVWAVLATFTLLYASRPYPAFAEFDLSKDDVEIHGFVMGNYAGRTTGKRPEAEQETAFLIGEERFRLDINTWADSIDASARVKVDLFHDAVDDKFDVDMREVYIDYSKGAFDFRLGRQITTWGVGDLLFINDVFPKDWESFFAGRPLEYLKIGVDGLRTRYSSKHINAELILTPFFEPDNMPSPDRFFMYDPFSDIETRTEDMPDKTFDNAEVALRVYRRVGKFDASAHFYHGFWRSPSMRLDDPTTPNEVIAFYSPLDVYGLSAQGPIPKGILLSLEGGFYHSRDDESGTDPTVPNSEARFLVGGQRQIIQDLTMGVQYYAEIMLERKRYVASLPPGFAARKKYRDTVTLRLEKQLMHQTLKLTFFAFYSPAEEDYLAQPQVEYKFSDKLKIAMGGNIFGGEKDTTFLGQFDMNDNVYLSARFYF